MGALPGPHWWRTPATQQRPTRIQGSHAPQPTPTESPPSTRLARALLLPSHPLRLSLSPHHLRQDSRRRRRLPYRLVSAGHLLPTTAAPPSPGTRSRGLLTAVLLGLHWSQTRLVLRRAIQIPGSCTPPLTRTGSLQSTRLGRALLPSPHPQRLLSLLHRHRQGLQLRRHPLRRSV